MASPTPPVADGLEDETRPDPDFATRRGFDTVDVDGAAGAGVEVLAPLSADLAGMAAAGFFAARKVLLTETGLNDVGFLIEAGLAAWPSDAGFDFTVSLADDPLLTLTSVLVGVAAADAVASVFGVADRSFSASFATGAGVPETS